MESLIKYGVISNGILYVKKCVALRPKSTISLEHTTFIITYSTRRDESSNTCV